MGNHSKQGLNAVGIEQSGKESPTLGSIGFGSQHLNGYGRSAQ